MTRFEPNSNLDADSHLRGCRFPNEPIEPLRPPGDAPNVLIILIDDVGFGAGQRCFEIEHALQTAEVGKYHPHCSLREVNIEKLMGGFVQSATPEFENAEDAAVRKFVRKTPQ